MHFEFFNVILVLSINSLTTGNGVMEDFVKSLLSSSKISNRSKAKLKKNCIL